MQSDSSPTPLLIETVISETYRDVYAADAWGERAFFVNPEMQRKRGVYFATIKSKDGPNDRASHLDREGFFRLNIGISCPLYMELFGPRPARPPKGGVVAWEGDFTEPDRLTPHPVYGWICWISILNPGARNFGRCMEYLDDAYGKALRSLSRGVGHGKR